MLHISSLKLEDLLVWDLVILTETSFLHKGLALDSSSSVGWHMFTHSKCLLPSLSTSSPLLCFIFCINLILAKIEFMHFFSLWTYSGWKLYSRSWAYLCLVRHLPTPTLFLPVESGIFSKRLFKFIRQWKNMNIEGI